MSGCGDCVGRGAGGDICLWRGICVTVRYVCLVWVCEMSVSCIWVELTMGMEGA